jgi:hypothetical protein
VPFSENCGTETNHLIMIMALLFLFQTFKFSSIEYLKCVKVKYGDKMKIEILNNYDKLKEFCGNPDDKQPPSGLTVLMRVSK